MASFVIGNNKQTCDVERIQLCFETQDIRGLSHIVLEGDSDPSLEKHFAIFVT